MISWRQKSEEKKTNYRGLEPDVSPVEEDKIAPFWSQNIFFFKSKIILYKRFSEDATIFLVS